MNELFREIDEELRRDRMTRLARQYGGLVVAGVVLVVAATGGWTAWRNWQVSQRQAATAELAEALSTAEQGRLKTAEALAGYAAKESGGPAALARLSEAGILAAEGKTAEAIAVYDAVAVSDAPQSYRELATLMSVMHQLGTGDPARMQERLQPLAAETSPWRFSAREMQAALAARSGDTDRARTLFQQLADDSAAPAGVRSRAADLAALYGKT